MIVDRFAPLWAIGAVHSAFNGHESTNGASAVLVMDATRQVCASLTTTRSRDSLSCGTTPQSSRNQYSGGFEWNEAQ